MSSLWRPVTKALAGLSAAAMFAFSQTAISARPGTVNYVEGHAFINGQEVDQKQIGHVNLDVNQAFRTGENSKAEILLTPGVFLRLGQNSEVKMVSPSLTDTRVAITHGEALIDVAELFKDNNIQILDGGSTTRLRKKGLYRFNAEPPSVAVFDGKATVQNETGHIDLKKGKQAFLTSGKLQAEKFDTKQKDELYAWSNLRSEYAAEASYASARDIVVNNYGGWGSGWGAGWFWNPGFRSWAFVPAAGYYYNPFGWGFYSPTYIYSAPLYYGSWGYRPGFAYRYRGYAYRPGIAARPHVGAGFHSGHPGAGIHHFGGPHGHR